MTDSSPSQPNEPKTFVSRAGAKLEHALSVFAIDVAGWACVDFGCNVGGFTDCLLKRGAASVVAVDTGYNVLAYSLRRDERVRTMERTNALHTPLPDDLEPLDMAVIDLAWTRQQRALPAAIGWLRPGATIVSLIKPHYELEPDEKSALLVDGSLDPGEAERVCERTVTAASQATGLLHHGTTLSPVKGAKSSRKGRGNVEFLAWFSCPE